jgi:hypothetical protein
MTWRKWRSTKEVTAPSIRFRRVCSNALLADASSALHAHNRTTFLTSGSLPTHTHLPRLACRLKTVEVHQPPYKIGPPKEHLPRFFVPKMCIFKIQVLTVEPGPSFLFAPGFCMTGMTVTRIPAHTLNHFMSFTAITRLYLQTPPTP